MNEKDWTVALTITAVLVILLWVNMGEKLTIKITWLQSPELDLDFVNYVKEDRSEVYSTTPEDFSKHHSIIKQNKKTEQYENETRGNNRVENELFNNSDFQTFFHLIKQCQILNPEDRFDCFPENTVTESGCVARGCCWHPTAARQKPLHTLNPSDPQAPVDVPYCYYPRDFPGYTVTSQRVTDTGFQATLQRNVTSYYPGDVMKLMMDVKFETSTRLHVKIFDPANQRYEVPLDVPSSTLRNSDPKYTVTVSVPGDPFSLTVTRKDAAERDPPIFTSAGAAPLIFTDQFLQLSSFLPSRYIYGLGQHRDSLLHSVNWTRFTMWNRDQPPTENTNLYGSHPTYLGLEEGGKSHGFFLLNSNAMDVILQPAPAITWRTIGGILDFYIFLGPSPADIVQQYLQVVGFPFMPPYWSLGLHVSRYGYKTVNQTKAVVNNIRKYGIPQDVQWNDIDYARDSLDFTIDYDKFGDQPAMVEEFHREGLHYCILIDPGMNNRQPKNTYPPYDIGLAMDLFIKNETDQPLVGKVWAGTTVWPDFTNPSSQIYWTSLVMKFHGEVHFDGTLIDMNEVSSFVNGSVYGCQDNPYDNPPYTPAVAGGKLNTRSVCASSKQYISRNYDVHNLYGSYMSKVTYQALMTTQKTRPFLISRATFPGQSKYGAHWTGDNSANYNDMYKSIPEVLTMSMLGVSMNGADICGFLDNTTTQLCQRWYQLGAFYTFSWTHNSDHCPKEQDPAAFGAVFAASVRKVYLTRYSLLPYLYTLFYKSHTAGETVARPLFFEFTDDVYTYSVDRQLLWGPALLISPVLEENATSVEAYFPSAVWYDFYTGQRVGKVGTSIELNAPLDVINLHVRGGFILPMQTPALTTTESRKNNFTLLVALDDQSQAVGDLFWDDGDAIHTTNCRLCNLIKFRAVNNTLKSEVLLNGYQTDMLLGNITIFGIKQQPSDVKIFNIHQPFTYNTNTKVLYVSHLNPEVMLTSPFLLTWF